ncbi:MAG: hypothetical protein GY855_04355, partial [candidate division Zixibacteria bacterium]|nr:hypothetical protein [candidate division Zixibacteria bacterium]
GVFGESYIKSLDKLLADRFPSLNYRLINKGRTGDTIYSLLKRAERDVISQRPNIVFILIGANDVVLRNPESLKALQEHSGIEDQIPSKDLNEFRSYYNQLVNYIKQFTRTRIILCSTGIIGEDLKNRFNRELVQINIAIRKIANDYRMDYIDISGAFHRELKNFHPKTDYTPRLPDIYEDLELLKTTTPDKLSQERGLKVTYDGGHLNTRGAQIVAEMFYDYLTG